jgi:hypothetical protein
MRSLVLGGLASALLLTGCLSPRQASPPTRETPAGTVEMFKVHARQRNYAGEWDILSTAFKERINQKADRHVDAADYSQARVAAMRDSQAQLAEQALQTAIVTRTQQIDANTVTATVQTSGGPFARSAQIRMVREQRWELFVTGQSEPYSGDVNDPSFTAERQADGSYHVVFRPERGDPQVTPVPAAQVREYRTSSKWYVDSLGELESQFFQ